jgi:acetyl esterase/lipase
LDYSSDSTAEIIRAKGSKFMNEKQNKRLMQVIKHVHGIMENDDINTIRIHQDQLASISPKSKDKKFEHAKVDINGMYGEWTKFSEEDGGGDIIFYCHGGGYMTGSCLYAREITGKLAKYTESRVFCFNYRLAPEHPYPAALEDALHAWEYVTGLGYDSKHITIAGDSAGGNLALSLSLLLREKGKPMAKCLVLFSPWTDMTSSGESYHANEVLDPILDNDYIRRAVEGYIGKASPKDPFVSPVFADFTGFPPVYIQVGTNEILYDDSHSLYTKLLKDNIYAKLDTFQGMWHVFQMSPIKVANEAILRVAEFIKNSGS